MVSTLLFTVTLYHYKETKLKKLHWPLVGMALKKEKMPVLHLIFHPVHKKSKWCHFVPSSHASGMLSMRPACVAKASNTLPSNLSLLFMGL